MSHISQVLSKGSGGTPSDTDGGSERLEMKPVFLKGLSKISVFILEVQESVIFKRPVM